MHGRRALPYCLFLVNRPHCSLQSSSQQQFEETLRSRLKTYPQTTTCEKHGQDCAISFNLTRQMFRALDVLDAGYSPAYEPCPHCQEEEAQAKEEARLLEMGIPPLLYRADLGQLAYQSENDQQNMAKVKQWAQKPIGFLVLLGGVGVGKSHIGAAILKEHRRGLFVSQSTLLRKLRETYHDRKAEDFVDKAKRVSLLVLDEVGVSLGGKDELPMLHEIVDHRYQHYLPTVITSNLKDEEFKAAIGDRLADRIREAAAHILRFCDSSKRSASNTRYLEMAAVNGSNVEKGFPSPRVQK